MNVKICRECGEPKPLGMFYADRRYESERSRCKECARKYNAKWREKNRSKHNANSLEWSRKNPEKQKEMNKRNYEKYSQKRASIRALIFNDYPCLACGESRHGCLTFHHLDPEAKEYNIGSQCRTWQTLLQEVSKCVVLCSNCHMLHHNSGLQLPKCNPIDVTKYQP